MPYLKLYDGSTMTNEMPHGSGSDGDAERRFLATPRDLLRHGLGSTDPDSWANRTRNGLVLPAQVFRRPDLAPMFYAYITPDAPALGLAGSVYNERVFDEARTPGEESEARLKTFGFNVLAAVLASAEEPEIKAAHQEMDIDAIAKHVPFAIALMSQPPEVRDKALAELSEHRPLRGMFTGIDEVWKPAIDATKESDRLTGTTWVHMKPTDTASAEDRERGILFAGGYDTLLVATAAYLGYIARPATGLMRRAGAGDREVIRLRGPDYKSKLLATPHDLHDLMRESDLNRLGIHVPAARALAVSNSAPSLEYLEVESPVLDIIREAVIARVGSCAFLEMTEEGIKEGSNTMALAFGATTTQQLLEVIATLDLLEPRGLRDSQLLKNCADIACERAELIAAHVRSAGKRLTYGSEFLKLHNWPLLDLVCRAVDNDVRSYAHREKPIHEAKFNGYVASVFAYLETICELVETIPDVQAVRAQTA